jgi:murein DD-endopeptidase MepM/ murein hydrolase activator NlpD
VSTVQIKYDGTDITALCSIDESTFTTASTNPGPCSVAFKDVRQRFRFTPGKTMELIIDGKRAWDGYLVSVGYNYWFGTHTANCEPCPHVTPRKLILQGVDRNILLYKRVMWDHENPTSLASQIWPPGTSDRTILIDAIDRYVDDLDGVDYTSMIEHVGTPDNWQDIRPNGPGATVYDLFRDIAKMTGAVFYIDPDRRLIYTDVETPNAPFGLSDKPGSGQVGYREMLLLHDASKMVNDALIWGAGQGSENIVFARVTDVASVLEHDRWQNTDGFRHNVWKMESAQHIAQTIVYGSPQNKRGHKDDGVSVRCTIYEPGLRVGEKANFETKVHNFTDVIPVREMTITFIDPGSPKYELYLSHEFDEPWTTREFWWPPLKRRDPPPDPPESCWLPVQGEIDYSRPLGIATGSTPRASDLGLLAYDFTVQTNEIDTFNNGILGVKTYYWFKYAWLGTYHNVPNLPGWEQTDLPLYNQYALGAAYKVTGWGIEYFGDRYVTYMEDTAWYWGFPGLYYYHDGWMALGDEMWEWASKYRRFGTPHVSSAYQDSPNFSSTYIGLRVEFELYLSAGQQSRTGAGFVDEYHGGPSGDYPGLGHAGIIGWSRSPGSSTVWPPRKVPSNVSGSFWLEPGETKTYTVDTVVPAGSQIHWSALLLEPNMNQPVGSATLRVKPLTTEWFPVREQSSAYISDLDPNVKCIPTYGDTCVEPRRDIDGTYLVGTSYYPDSLRVYLDGIHISPTEYTEYPSRGEFVLDKDPDDAAVWACFGIAGHAVMPDTSVTGALFILPVDGPITGLFGPQTSLWPPAVWHGTYYPHFHNGVDFGVVIGTPVYAAAAGKVAWETQEAGGIMIHIYHPFYGFRTTYAHLSGRVVADGAQVTQGQHIGYSGNTGQVTGAHLHWGLVYAGSPEDPMPYTQVSASEALPPLVY